MHPSNTRLNLVSFESLYLGLCELTVRKSWKWSHFAKSMLNTKGGNMIKNLVFTRTPFYFISMNKNVTKSISNEMRANS
jgi:hypothetical protein